MATYRPKSLEELNDMYEKAMSAQQAIKKGTSQLNADSEPDFDLSVDNDFEIEAESVAEKTDGEINEISSEVEQFISKLNEKVSGQSSDEQASQAQSPAQEKSVQHTPTVEKPIQQHPVFQHSAPQNSTYEKPVIVRRTPHKPETQKPETESVPQNVEPKADSEPDFTSFVQKEKPQDSRIPNARRIQKELQAAPEQDNITGLINDYVKIMNDEDDDIQGGRRSLFSHKKGRKSQKSNYDYMEQTDDGDTQSIEAAEDEQPFGPVQPPKDEYFEAAMENTDPNMDGLVYDDEAYRDPKGHSEKQYDDEEGDRDDIYDDIDPDFFRKKQKSKKERRKNKKKNKAEKSAQLEQDESDDDLTADDEENSFEVESDNELEENKGNVSEKKSGKRLALRILASVMFVICLLNTVAAISLNLVFNVNTGKLTFGNKYYFAAEYDYTDAKIEKGDFVVCETVDFLSDGEKTVYIYTDPGTNIKKVSFGIKSGGLTNDNGDIVYLVSGRTVSKEDVLGVVKKTVPTLGSIVSAVFNYYIAVIVGFVALTICFFLIATVVLRKKDKPRKVKGNKASRKKDEPSPENDEDLQEESDNYFDSLD